MNNVKRFCCGCIGINGEEDFYWDTRFASWDEAFDWGVNHDCTHIYDSVENSFTRIQFL